MTHEQRIAEIREREKRATAEPWEVIPNEPHKGEISGPDKHLIANRHYPQNQDFIAHARSDIPFLLKQLDTLAAECLRLRDLMLQIDQALDAAKEAK